MRDSRYDVLFEPVHVGPKTLRNRFVQVPHCSGFGTERPQSQAHLRGMKAEGGWAAVFVESSTVAPEAELSPHTLVDLFDDDDVANLLDTTSLVHERGALAGILLSYRLPSGTWLGHLETRAPFRGTVMTVDAEDIRDICALYAAGAKRAAAAGFDLITVYAAHGVGTILQFLTCEINRRTDEYGGPFANRARLAREVVTAVRDAVDEACAVGMRFMVDSLPPPHGTGFIRAEDDGLRFIAHLDDIVDYWDVKVGSWYSGEDAAPSRTHPENHEQAYVTAVKAFTSKPVINVGRFLSPDTMAKVIAEGQCDLIGAARPSIADPFLPVKIDEGRLADIVPCIGCNMCVAKWELGGSPIVCTQNATMGEEFRRGWHPERFSAARNRDKEVLIVGAGPAGLECARVLGERGMRRVLLVEAEAAVGGYLRWIPKLPGLAEWRHVVQWRQTQLSKLRNVVVLTNSRFTPERALSQGAAIIVVATGSRWADDGTTGEVNNPVPGANAALAHVLTPEQLILEHKAVGERVLVYDADGYFMGHSVTALLAKRNHHVTYMTPADIVAPFTKYTLEFDRVYGELRNLGVKLLLGAQLIEVTEGTVISRDKYTARSQEESVESLILVTGRKPEDRLYRELRSRNDDRDAAGVEGLYAIGDCLGPDFLSEAIFSGHRLAREIDSGDPARPLPYFRDRRIAVTDDVKRTLSSLRDGA